MDKLFLTLGSLLGGLGVALGAFGAHGLKTRLTADSLATFETAVRYQVYHAIALVLVALAISAWPGSRWSNAAGWLFFAGVILFSGSLYLLVGTGQRWLGAITPLGGVAFIAGWICLALSVWLK